MCKIDILDIHSHILPGVDDGAKDLEESVKLLEMLKEQGVTAVLATPHFYGMQDSIEDFLERRENAKKALLNEIKDRDLPAVYIGGEILYFPGMGGIERVKELGITGAKYILLEFSVIDFNDTVCRDILNIRDNFGLIPIIAHIERYKKFKNYKKLLKLVEAGEILSQVNAGSVVEGVFSKSAHKLLKKNLVHFIGSDTHSVDHRPPFIKEAYRIIGEKYGKETENRLKENSSRFLEELK